MNIEERLALNTQKLTGLVERIRTLDLEKENLLQEALRIDGENRVLNEQLKEKED